MYIFKIIFVLQTSPPFKAHVAQREFPACTCNEVVHVCCISFSGCQESYEVEENRYACVAGCKLQEHIPSPDSYLEVSIK